MARKVLGSNGRVIAVDYKFTGEEPTWYDFNSLTDDQIVSRQCKAFYFYSYYLENDDWKPILKPWFKENGFSDHQFNNLKAAIRQPECLVAAKIIRCIQLGFPAKHKLIPSPKEIKKRFTDAFFNANITTEERVNAETSTPKRQAPLVSIQNKTRESFIVPIEKFIDTWILNKDTKIKRIDMVKTLSQLQIPVMALPMVVTHLVKYRDEYLKALMEEHKDYVEAYSYLSKKALLLRVAYLNKMIKEVQTFRGIKVATRKKRVKKTKSVDQQIRKLKFQADSKEFNLTSINPAHIPGAQHLYVFNTKYRAITVLHAQSAAGFEIKGTTIQNFDDKISYTQSLRKPNDTLQLILGKQPKAIEKELSKLTTKKKKANGRINEQCIILKATNAQSL